MNYLELDIRIDPLIPFREIVIAYLSEVGFESFLDTSNGLKAFISEEDSQGVDFATIFRGISDCKLEWSENLIPHKNWNAEWEKKYEPAVVNEKCVIRALFHDPMPEYEFEVIIQPQMSFGTGHHPTTLLMIEMLLEKELKGRTLMDIGTGTGILSILAEKKGALDIVATDIEDHIIANAKDNVRHNGCVNIRVDKADIALTSSAKYGFILANINLNTLIESLGSISSLAEEGSTILMSGFFATDTPALISRAREYGLQLIHQKERERWAVVEFRYSG